jgi:hypothetical protein
LVRWLGRKPVKLRITAHALEALFFLNPTLGNFFLKLRIFRKSLAKKLECLLAVG